MLHVENKKVLVIGGGEIACRKIKALLEQGAIVTCISPNITKELQTVKPSIEYKQREFQIDDIGGFFVVVAATDDELINKAVYDTSQSQGIICMTVDHVNPSDYEFMAKRAWKDLTIAVSTHGQAPGFSKSIVSKLASLITEKELDELQAYISSRKQKLDS